MTVRIDESLEGIDWAQAKADLAADDFDNGRSPQALRASFEQSQHVAIAWDGDRVVGMARLLSDGVCNAYLLDVWTMSAYRRQGIGAAMVRQLMARAPGQHIGLQTDDAEAFYTSLGYQHQPAVQPLFEPVGQPAARHQSWPRARHLKLGSQQNVPLGRRSFHTTASTISSAVDALTRCARRRPRWPL